jgi:hypothetical protein
MPDASLFRSGRQFAAWLELTPRANGSGRKERLGGTTKQGNGYLRRLLAVGATAVMQILRKSADRRLGWRTPGAETCEDRDSRVCRQNGAHHFSGNVAQRSLRGRDRATVVPRCRQMHRRRMA